MNEIKLRAHHVLCSVLYKGMGYSDEFTDNMTFIVDKLRNKCDVCLISDPDIICKECPNAMADGSCALDAENTDGCIKDLDQYVLDGLKLTKNKIYHSSDMYQCISNVITESFFNNCCSECRWHKMGLCSYDLYMSRIGSFIR